MKKTIIILFVFCMLAAKPLISFGQITLTIEVTGLRNNNGLIILQLVDENQKDVKSQKGVIKNNKCTIIFDDLKSAKYAFRYFHDENKNNKLDTKWLGIPVEGFGFSNNAKGKFGPPAFEKWIFDLKGNITLTCKPTYYL